MKAMSEESRHTMSLVPAQVKIVQHARFIYGCRNREKNGIEVSIIPWSLNFNNIDLPTRR
jgi:hypothetical protein